MRWWCRILPVCFVVWYCRRYCSSIGINDERVHVPWDDVRILTSDDNERFKTLRKKQRLERERQRLEWKLKEMEMEGGE